MFLSERNLLDHKAFQISWVLQEYSSHRKGHVRVLATQALPTENVPVREGFKLKDLTVKDGRALFV